MLRLSRLALLTAATLAIPSTPSSAMAAPPIACAKKDAQTGICLVEAASPGQVPGEASGVNDGAPQGADGVDSPPNPCTYTVADPQPSHGHPVWAGHRPEEGTIWTFTCPRPAGFGSGLWSGLLFLADGAETPAGPEVDPRVLAQQAIASMTLRAPEIQMAPPTSSMSGLVGLPVWMWVERSADITGPARASASAGGMTVTAVAQVSQVLWNMGDGNTVTCGLGTPYADGAGTASPDCGYVYATASSRHVPGGGPWPITATSRWTITWSGAGASGTETLELSSSSELFVGELHVLNQDGGSR
jgi:hypothetical protein